MRNKQFVAIHRGGELSKINHKKLIGWARTCSNHVLSLLDEKVDSRLINALKIAEEWENDCVTTGIAIKASLEAHKLARESKNPITIAVARSVGQAVATAHMADHCLGAALYALKVVKLAGKSVDEEKEWQLKQLRELSDEIKNLILNALAEKSVRI